MTDLIHFGDLIDILEWDNDIERWTIRDEDLERIPRIITPRVAYGEWIKIGESCGIDILECSVCHRIHPQSGDAFCRDCGAIMQKGID